MLQRGLSTAHWQMVMLGLGTAKERVATFLVIMAKRVGITHSGILELSVGRNDIADYTGLTLETVCRQLSILQHEGRIEILENRRIKISNPESLQSVCDGRSDKAMF